MSNLNNILFDTMSAIVDKKLEQAGYNQTIRGRVQKVVDAPKCIYSIKYQDAYFNATAADSTSVYKKGDLVYVLVPNGNFSSNKIIIGLADRMGVSSNIKIANSIDYEDLFIYGLDQSYSYSFSSYDGRKFWNLKENAEENLDEDDEPPLSLSQEFLRFAGEADCIRLSLKVKTQIPEEQRVGMVGRYGVTANFIFSDINGVEEKIPIIFTCGEMIGNIYNFSVPTEQCCYINIPEGKEIKEVTDLVVFCSNFPNREEDKEADIFLTDINISLAKQRSSSIVLKSDSGFVFNTYGDENATKTITATLYYTDGDTVRAAKDPLFYWYAKDYSITTNTGSNGWTCIREDVNPFVISKDEIFLEQQDFKCVAVYPADRGKDKDKQEDIDLPVFERQFTLYNVDPNYEIVIGTEDEETRNLILEMQRDGKTSISKNISLERSDEPGLDYSDWSGTENVEYRLSDLVEEYKNGARRIKDTITNLNGDKYILTADLFRGDTLVEPEDDSVFTWFETTENNQRIERGEGGALWPVDSESYSNIRGDRACELRTSLIKGNYSTISCGTTYMGDTSFICAIREKIVGNYALTLIPSRSSFGYNIDGSRPITDNREDATISFELLDMRTGETVPEEEFTYYWNFPAENTSLILKNPSTISESIEDGFYIISGYSSLSYNIKDMFSGSQGNNTIKIEVLCNGQRLSDSVNIDISMVNKPGSNGTGYYLAPVNENDEIISDYVIDRYKTNGFSNDIPNNKEVVEKMSDNVFGKVYYNTTEMKDISVSKEFSEGEDYIRLKAKTTINYKTGENRTYNLYEAVPVVSVIAINEEYARGITLRENSGFNMVEYNNVGKAPQYNQSNGPFVIDINTSTPISNISYRWEKSENIVHSLDESGSTYHAVPSSFYQNSTTDEYIDCFIYSGNNIVALVHIAIYMYYNRYAYSGINDWDGKSIDVSGENLNNGVKTIYSPQMVAGEKNDKNEFQGIIMGKVIEKSDDGESALHGLLGYNGGTRTFFLNADTGELDLTGKITATSGFLGTEKGGFEISEDGLLYEIKEDEDIGEYPYQKDVYLSITSPENFNELVFSFIISDQSDMEATDRLRPYRIQPPEFLEEGETLDSNEELSSMYLLAIYDKIDNGDNFSEYEDNDSDTTIGDNTLSEDDYQNLEGNYTASENQEYEAEYEEFVTIKINSDEFDYRLTKISGGIQVDIIIKNNSSNIELNSLFNKEGYVLKEVQLDLVFEYNLVGYKPIARITPKIFDYKDLLRINDNNNIYLKKSHFEDGIYIGRELDGVNIRKIKGYSTDNEGSPWQWYFGGNRNTLRAGIKNGGTEYDIKLITKNGNTRFPNALLLNDKTFKITRAYRKNITIPANGWANIMVTSQDYMHSTSTSNPSNYIKWGVTNDQGVSEPGWHALGIVGFGTSSGRKPDGSSISVYSHKVVTTRIRAFGRNAREGSVKILWVVHNFNDGPITFNAAARILWMRRYD